MYWNNTVFSFINETISGRFDERDFEELYSLVDPTEQKYKDFNERCVNSPSVPYLKYIGTSSTVRDLVSLGDAIVGQGEPIDYWGTSYGTVLGFNFLNSKLNQLLYPTPVLKIPPSVPRGVLDTAWMLITVLSICSVLGM